MKNLICGDYRNNKPVSLATAKKHLYGNEVDLKEMLNDDYDCTHDTKKFVTASRSQIRKWKAYIELLESMIEHGMQEKVFVDLEAGADPWNEVDDYD